jgi:hypothetical protein
VLQVGAPGIEKEGEEEEDLSVMKNEMRLDLQRFELMPSECKFMLVGVRLSQ